MNNPGLRFLVVGGTARADGGERELGSAWAYRAISCRNGGRPVMGAESPSARAIHFGVGWLCERASASWAARGSIGQYLVGMGDGG